MAGFDCGKKRDFNPIPLIGTNTVCPLAKFRVHASDEINDWPTIAELDYLCEVCEHRDKSSDTKDEFSLASCFESHCIDCPVESCRENIQECMAEAALS